MPSYPDTTTTQKRPTIACFIFVCERYMVYGVAAMFQCYTERMTIYPFHVKYFQTYSGNVTFKNTLGWPESNYCAVKDPLPCH